MNNSKCNLFSENKKGWKKAKSGMTWLVKDPLIIYLLYLIVYSNKVVILHKSH